MPWANDSENASAPAAERLYKLIDCEKIFPRFFAAKGNGS
jgi:hypothetical protein